MILYFPWIYATSRQRFKLSLHTLYDSLANRAWRSIYLKENRERNRIILGKFGYFSKIAYFELPIKKFQSMEISPINEPFQN